eukprot:6404287-Prymnesium_polylepis.2
MSHVIYAAASACANVSHPSICNLGHMGLDHTLSTSNSDAKCMRAHAASSHRRGSGMACPTQPSNRTPRSSSHSQGLKGRYS